MLDVGEMLIFFQCCFDCDSSIVDFDGVHDTVTYASWATSPVIFGGLSNSLEGIGVVSCTLQK